MSSACTGTGQRRRRRSSYVDRKRSRADSREKWDESSVVMAGSSLGLLVIQLYHQNARGESRRTHGIAVTASATGVVPLASSPAPPRGGQRGTGPPRRRP